jgi:hypothetical protein
MTDPVSGQVPTMQVRHPIGSFDRTLNECTARGLVQVRNLRIAWTQQRCPAG